ncbi:HET-domain-containing protein, partial [Trematosphaeria pertusa]
QIDLPVLKKWRERCKEEHGYHCKPLLPSPYEPKHRPDEGSLPFRVIDVVDDRVIPAPRNWQYVALSYVWGGAVPFRLKRADISYTQANCPSFESSYASLHRKKLPRTIQDAMFVVELLEERYLWIDCLCIVQDDAEELKANIHSMDRIFSAAQLTIVGASGHDANAGLPGLYPKTRYVQPITGSVDGIGIAQIEPTLRLEHSVWGFRGWT